MAQIYAGIDVGTANVKVVIAVADGSALRVAGTGMSNSKGMRHGYIINVLDVTKSVSEALKRAEQAAGVRVRNARLAIGGVGLDELRSSGEISLTASGGEVTERDIQRVIQDSERRASAKLTNRKVIHALPLSYRIDSTEILGRPIGMKGAKLSVETLLVTAFEQHVNDLIQAVEAAQVEVDDIMASPLAASLVTLTKAQKMAGVVLANIGAETVSMAVFENDSPISIKVLPAGSADITNDLALSLQISPTEAEQMKRGAVTNSNVPRKKIDDVVSGRLKDIFMLIGAHLKAIGKHRLLPAGIIITGGGSGITTASDIARAALRLPSQVGSYEGNVWRTVSGDAAWAVAYGLCKWGFSTDQKVRERGMGYISENIKDYLHKAFRSFLP